MRRVRGRQCQQAREPGLRRARRHRQAGGAAQAQSDGDRDRHLDRGAEALPVVLGRGDLTDLRARSAHVGAGRARPSRRRPACGASSAVATAPPARRDSAASPVVFPSVRMYGRERMERGILDNTPLDIAINDGAKEILAISLMAGGENEQAPVSWPELIARTLQLSLHHQMLSDYERLRERARITVLCPITAPTATWEMKRDHIDSVVEASRVATAAMLAQKGSRFARHSGIQYLELGG